MANHALSSGITSGRQLMELRRVELEYGDKKIAMYETEREGVKFLGKLRECLLFSMGYGTDQAAELRYEMARENRKPNKKTADVLKAEG